MEEFTEEYLEMFRNWNDIEGDATVREFWMAFLVHIIVVSILGALSRFSLIFGVIDSLYAIVIFIPSITLFIRRMNDIKKSPWNFLWIFTGIGIIYVIYLTIQQSK